MKFHYWLCWCLLRAIFSTYFRWRIIGEEQVPKRGALIFASNHASFLDPPLIGSSVHREAFYLARESLFRVPILGRIISSINALPVDRSGKSPRGLKTILARLSEGKAVVLFPEGTRSADGSLLPARSGIGLAVVQSSAKVVPVRIFGSFQSYSRKMRFPRPKKITIVYGMPIDFSNEIKAAKSSVGAKKRHYSIIANHIMKQIEKLNYEDDHDQ